MKYIKFNFQYSALGSQSGQSLVEMIVAIAIILTGLVGALSLTISNLSGVDEAGTRVVASNLAREGVEVVRNFRDTNWLQNLDWDTGLFLINDFTAIAVFNPLTNKWHLNFTPNTVADPAAKLYRGAENIYLQDVVPPGGTATFYSRLLTLDPICFNALTQTENITGNSCGAGEEKIGIRVKSEVIWNLSGRPRDVTLEDRIYNWR
ncbi:MAG: prepilin-type N-terminal cleavage/methylation domain-containing protein [Patescibacteria group bacterium]